MLIREVILENFMSYEYARIPLKKGVNVVCGPNGAGKSSILLGISVALAQSSTERSRRLSDLIRYGKEEARITLVLDNTPRNGKRPVTRIKSDQIFLTRNLRRDGKYWFELQNTAANKTEVSRILAKFEVDPDNMLIVMHQNMVEQFSVLTSQEKLRMVEAAVGLEPYRQNVVKAQKKLSRTLSQEDSVSKLLESASQTLTYWREQYDRYQKKKQLILKRRFLERELAWAEVLKREKVVAKIEKQNQEGQKRLTKLDWEIKKTEEQLEEQQINLTRTRSSWTNLFEGRLTLERQIAKLELTATIANQEIEETLAWTKDQRSDMKEVFDALQSLEYFVKEKTNPTDLDHKLAEIKSSYATLQEAWSQRLKLRSTNLRMSVKTSKEQFGKLNEQIMSIKEQANQLNQQIENITTTIVDQKISYALLQYQKESITKDLKNLEKERKHAFNDLVEYVKKAETVGQRLVPMKNTLDILEELRLTDGHLAALSDVSKDIERMYESYSRLYLELKDKARLVSENREKALQEVNTRIDSWRNVIHNLLDQVNNRYRKILSKAYATGEIKLVNEYDIEGAGLEIFVGFKGGEPVPLNAYTQSGGERSTATITFLLALQQNVNSPFRAVDEYDVHMDPKNRELIANLLISSVAGTDSQYLAITPSQLTFTEENIHLITVQNVEGASLIREVT